VRRIATETTTRAMPGMRRGQVISGLQPPGSEQIPAAVSPRKTNSEPPARAARDIETAMDFASGTNTAPGF